MSEHIEEHEELEHDTLHITVGGYVTGFVLAVILTAILILAIALCVLFQRSGSLLLPFVAHATFNSFATSLIILNGLGVFELPM